MSDGAPIGPAEAAERMAAAVQDGASVACVLVVGGPGAAPGRRFLVVRDTDGRVRRSGSLGSPELDRAAARVGRTALEDPRHRDGIVEVDPEQRAAPGVAPDHGASPGPLELYVEVRHPVPELVIVGAGHIARPLCEIGALLGFRVVVVDDRPDFATRERFPRSERVVRADFSDPFADVPVHGRTHLLLVTRGHKYDYECLVRVLRLEEKPAYIGMIGSRRRVRATWVQLMEEGISRADIEEIHAPVGLDVGAETPEEIAVAVAAELVLVRRGGTGVPLRDVERVAHRFFGDDAPERGAEPPEPSRDRSPGP